MMHSSESKAEFNDDIGCVPSDDAEEENTYYSAVFDVLKQSGIQISKVGKTGPIHKTTVKLSPDGAFLVWRAKRKGLRQARVPLEVVSRVTTGQVSRNFARLNASFFYKHANSEPGAEERSLSLAWDTGKQSLDMVIKISQVLEKRIEDCKLKNECGMKDQDVHSILVAALRWKVDQLSKLLHHEPVEARYIRELFEEADDDRSGSVDLAEAMTISAKLNLGKPRDIVEQAVRDRASDDGTLNLEGFTAIMLELIGSQDVDALWAGLCSQAITMNTATLPIDALNTGFHTLNDGLHQFLRGALREKAKEFGQATISSDKFAKFLLDIQKESQSNAAHLMSSLHLKLPKSLANAAAKQSNEGTSHRIGKWRTKKTDNLESSGSESSAFVSTVAGHEVFSELVSGSENTLVSPQFETTVYHDMSRPLNQYWIASSHNTYLTGDQLMSASSIDRYIDDLMEGCRCVELDCWDNSDGEPCIYHGGTMTSKISFKAVIQAIADFGFKTSPYPIILSFENHCSPPFQLKMAQHLKDILLAKDLLWLPPDSSLHPTPSSEPITQLPSPEDAKYKVIVKAKVGRFATHESHKQDNTKANVVPMNETEGDDAEKGGGEEPEAANIDELDDLVSIKGRKMKSLQESIDSQEAEMIHSLKESKVEKVISKNNALLLKLLEYKLIRTYPDNFRVDSSNYDPVVCWNYGCQIVALNYQTSDLPMQLNRGRFRDNGNCGYLLRPPFFQPAAEKEASMKALNAKQRQKAEKRLLKKEKADALKKKRAEKKAASQASRSAALFAHRMKVSGKKTKKLKQTLEEERNQAAITIQQAARLYLGKLNTNKEAEEGKQEDIKEEEVDSDGELGEIEKGNTLTDDDPTSNIWSPPTDSLSYVKTSKYGNQAISLSIRVFSASHLPAPPLMTGRRASMSMKDSVRNMDIDSGGGAVQGDWGGNDKVSLEVEVFGAPCDKKQWSPSKEVGNDGVRHMFDETFSCDIAEPRLALVRFSLARKGVAVAQTVIPAHLIRPGVRWTQLFDPLSQSNKVSNNFLLTRLLLFVKVESLPGALKDRKKKSKKTNKMDENINKEVEEKEDQSNNIEISPKITKTDEKQLDDENNNDPPLLSSSNGSGALISEEEEEEVTDVLNIENKSSVTERPESPSEHPEFKEISVARIKNDTNEDNDNKIQDKSRNHEQESDYFMPNIGLELPSLTTPTFSMQDLSSFSGGISDRVSMDFKAPEMPTLTSLTSFQQGWGTAL